MKLQIAMLFELGPNDQGILGGGVENHIFNLSLELIKMGHKVFWITGAIPNNKRRINIKGIEIIRLDLLSLISRTFNSQQLFFSRQLLFLVRNFMQFLKDSIDLPSIDIFHGHVYSSGLSALFLSKITNRPVINTIHGSYYQYWHEMANPIVALIYRHLEKFLSVFLANKCHYQIHTDVAFYNLVKSWCKANIRHKVVSILNGVNLNLFHPNVKPVREIKENEGPVIVTTRRLVYKNGVRFLVKAFKDVIKKNRYAKLLIIGDGPEKLLIQKQIVQLGLKDHIKIMGMIPNQEIPKYLALADILIVPSIVEASSLSVLEGMAMKKPIVATNIPGIQEITNYGEMSLLVKPKDSKELANAIIKLIDDRDLANQLANRAYYHVKNNYSWEKQARQVLDIYMKSLN
ncbi:MAG: glycosyltransferase family 4 protein [Candidatus Heimdallarchaeaceae archaeon]